MLIFQEITQFITLQIMILLKVYSLIMYLLIGFIMFKSKRFYPFVFLLSPIIGPLVFTNIYNDYADNKNHFKIISLYNKRKYIEAFQLYDTIDKDAFRIWFHKIYEPEYYLLFISNYEFIKRRNN